MSRFRASDEALEREIVELERIARLRVRRAVSEMQDLDRDLRELKRERARRRAEALEVTPASAPAEGASQGTS
jgi:hypothetical protein